MNHTPYRSVTTQTVNPILRPVYDQLRSSSNLLVEEQAILPGNLEIMLEED